MDSQLDLRLRQFDDPPSSEAKNTTATTIYDFNPPLYQEWDTGDILNKLYCLLLKQLLNFITVDQRCPRTYWFWLEFRSTQTLYSFSVPTADLDWPRAQEVWVVCFCSHYGKSEIRCLSVKLSIKQSGWGSQDSEGEIEFHGSMHELYMAGCEAHTSVLTK